MNEMRYRNPSNQTTLIRLSLKHTTIEWEAHLGSAQKDALSSSGTISVTFKYLAMATMSHICTIKSNNQKTKAKQYMLT
jgi:hypothetical protein